VNQSSIEISGFHIGKIRYNTTSIAVLPLESQQYDIIEFFIRGVRKVFYHLIPQVEKFF